jgi:Ras-related protein Rab-5C
LLIVVMRSSAATAITKTRVMLGSASTGKTSIVNRFAHNRAASHTESTIGAAFVSKVITIGDIEVKLEIWDTGGSEKYRALAPMYYRDCNAAILVFDVTVPSSLDDANVWLEELRDRGPPAVLVALAANKIDLSSNREIDDQKVSKFSSQNEISLVKATSALTGENVVELFTELTAKLMDNQQMLAPSKSQLRPAEAGRSGCC